MQKHQDRCLWPLMLCRAIISFKDKEGTTLLAFLQITQKSSLSGMCAGIC